MIHVGDCREILRTLDAESVQCVVTSPPYFGLRDYGVTGQIGLEDRADCLGWATGAPCGECFVCAQVSVFREVRRVLRADGTCWVNLGDSYSGTGKSGGGKQGARWDECGADTEGPRGGKWKPPPAGMKQKDLMGMPWRVALALQADGWWLRQDIIWSKPNPMPESIKDRCTKAHEYLFLLTKSERYYFDAEAIKEPVSGTAHARCAIEYSGMKRPGFGHGYDKAPKPRYKTPDGWDTSKGAGQHGSIHRSGREKGSIPDAGDVGRRYHRKSDLNAPNVKNNESFDAALTEVRSSRNKRSVWHIPTQPFSEAHFATFPEALVEPCILAGSRAGDTVLDPFMGAGTTALVADRLGRQWIGCELNPEYAAIAERRLRGRTAGLALAGGCAG